MRWKLIGDPYEKCMIFFPAQIKINTRGIGIHAHTGLYPYLDTSARKIILTPQLVKNARKSTVKWQSEDKKGPYWTAFRIELISRFMYEPVQAIKLFSFVQK